MTPAAATERASIFARSDRDRSNLPMRAGRWLALLAATAMVVFLALPLAGLLWRTIERFDGVSDRTATTLREALALSLTTTCISMAIVLLLGTPLAYLLGRHVFRGKNLLETLIDLPIVLPPAVAGLALLMAFGRRGLIGEYLDQHFGITIGFTTTAVVMAQIFVASPFYVRAARAGFARFDKGMEEAAADLGADPWHVLRTVTVPMARPAIGAGLVLAWARALGEFGATIMFAGSIAGRTETMPLAVYSRYEAGDLDTALLLSVILVACATLVLLSVRLANRPSGDVV
jgi:molybdate transport system permease protein